MDKILEVKNLRTYFYLGGREIPSVDGVSFDVNRGETLCIVGESGCGKSVTAASIMKLVSTPPGKYVGGQIIFEGENILDKTKGEIVKIRGKDISMIFQEPMTALNPVHTVGAQIAEVFLTHKKCNKKEAKGKAIEMLQMVGVPDAKRCASSYPHQLSGGMRQRVVIAMAFACSPKLLIADEPTTALDVTVQAQILDLIKKLKEDHGMTVIFITHDLGVVAEIAQKVIVMYSGRIVEKGTCLDIFKNPLHPYTRGLLKCVPRIDQKENVLDAIEGYVPNPSNFPKGCRFHPRCSECMEICKTTMPEIVAENDHSVACHLLNNK